MLVPKETAVLVTPCHPPPPNPRISLTDHGGTPGNCCFGAMIKIVNGYSPHDWELEMRMGVDATGNDKLACCINGSSALWHLDVSTDLPAQEKRIYSNEVVFGYLFSSLG